MLFNSIEFLIFLPVVFFLYWFVFKNSLKIQNLFLLIVSYVFYGWWDYRFLALIIFSTVVDYFIGIGIGVVRSSHKKKILLGISLFVNLGLLGFFKYYNFFVDSFIDSFGEFGIDLNFNTLNIILPVGISFYTFQTLSYSIDVYRNKLEPTRDFIAFGAFVSFFPQLVAGPIERATNLLPQFKRKRKFTYQEGIDGLLLISWGFFKKIVIADNVAPSVNDIFDNYETYSGDILILGAFLFAVQIYGDFSGYSSIARGLAKWFGFELMYNFKYPYFSRNIGEFWRKWHISLSTWFRDYLYIPLGGSRKGSLNSFRNILIIFLVSGFWHGANWTFLVWGGIHALLFLPSFFMKTNRKHLGLNFGENVWFPPFREIIAVGVTFSLVTIAWVFFRADSIHTALFYLKGMLNWFEHVQYLNPYDNQSLVKEFLLILLLFITDYFLNANKLDFLTKNYWSKSIVSSLLIVLVLINNPLSKDMSFIYFQF